ncbi:MAG: DUF504 domain-containing protein [Povalibacter sp.]
MRPIHELLSQIRWDPNFKGQFEIAYADHMKPELERVPVSEARFDPRDTSVFKAFNENGEVVSIPLHRIRRVYRNHQLIWSRDKH